MTEYYPWFKGILPVKNKPTTKQHTIFGLKTKLTWTTSVGWGSGQPGGWQPCPEGLELDCLNGFLPAETILWFYQSPLSLRGEMKLLCPSKTHWFLLTGGMHLEAVCYSVPCQVTRKSYKAILKSVFSLLTSIITVSTVLKSKVERSCCKLECIEWVITCILLETACINVQKIMHTQLENIAWFSYNGELLPTTYWSFSFPSPDITEELAWEGT